MHGVTHFEGGDAETTTLGVHNALLLLKNRLSARRTTGYHRHCMSAGDIQSNTIGTPVPGQQVRTAQGCEKEAEPDHYSQ